MSMDKGYVKIYRDIYDDALWNVDEPYDKRSAWIDLILMANYKDSEMILGVTPKTIRRGQIFTSIEHLAERWKWGRKRTLAYLRMLQATGKVTLYSTTKGTTITLVKYGDYQSGGQTNSSTKGTTNDSTTDSTTDRHLKKVKEEYKESKRNIAASPLVFDGDY